MFIKIENDLPLADFRKKALKLEKGLKINFTDFCIRNIVIRKFYYGHLVILLKLNKNY